jgi:DNA-binding response OmpR family regulator
MAFPPVPVGSYRVLVVDDYPDAAESLARLLELWGFGAAICHDGADAVLACHNYRPHAVLLDIGLPHMDGCEVATVLRQQTRSEYPLLIAVTGFGEDHNRRRCHESGFAHVLVKPVNLDGLRNLLCRELDGKVDSPR